jgi:L-malate glycosyltransferase
MTDNHTTMRIVHIASGDLWAGAEVQLYQVVTRLASMKDIRVSVILLNHGILEARLQAAGIGVTVLDEKLQGGLTLLSKLIHILRREQPNVVHTHRRKENVLGALATLALRNVRLIQTVHGSDEFTLAPWQVHKHAYSLLDTLCGRLLFDRIVAVSAPLADKLKERFSRYQVVIVENGIDVDGVRQAASTIVHSLPGSARKIKIGIAGRMVAVKRFDLFLQIAASTIRQAPGRFSFYIFGDGPLHDDLVNLASQLGIIEDVHFSGFVPDLPAHLTQLDLLLITSDHEGLPMVLLEAMVLSVPIISHAVGGIPRVLGNGRFGTLLPSQEPSMYADVLLEFSKNRSPFDKKSADAYNAVSRSYSAQQCAEAYLDVYRGHS